MINKEVSNKNLYNASLGKFLINLKIKYIQKEKSIRKSRVIIQVRDVINARKLIKILHIKIKNGNLYIVEI